MDFILWILYQFLIAWMQMAGLSRASAMAHLGVALAGFLFWLWLRTPSEVIAEVIESGQPPKHD